MTQCESMYHIAGGRSLRCDRDAGHEERTRHRVHLGGVRGGELTWEDAPAVSVKGNARIRWGRWPDGRNFRKSAADR